METFIIPHKAITYYALRDFLIAILEADAKVDNDVISTKQVISNSSFAEMSQDEFIIQYPGFMRIPERNIMKHIVPVLSEMGLAHGLDSDKLQVTADARNWYRQYEENSRKAETVLLEFLRRIWFVPLAAQSVDVQGFGELMRETSGNHDIAEDQISAAYELGLFYKKESETPTFSNPSTEDASLAPILDEADDIEDAPSAQYSEDPTEISAYSVDADETLLDAVDDGLSVAIAEDNILVNLGEGEIQESSTSDDIDTMESDVLIQHSELSAEENSDVAVDIVESWGDSLTDQDDGRDNELSDLPPIGTESESFLWTGKGKQSSGQDKLARALSGNPLERRRSRITSQSNDDQIADLQVNDKESSPPIDFSLPKSDQEKPLGPRAGLTRQRNVKEDTGQNTSDTRFSRLDSAKEVAKSSRVTNSGRFPRDGQSPLDARRLSSSSPQDKPEKTVRDRKRVDNQTYGPRKKPQPAPLLADAVPSIADSEAVYIWIHLKDGTRYAITEALVQKWQMENGGSISEVILALTQLFHQQPQDSEDDK